MNLRTCLSEDEKKRVRADIQKAEQKTSGDIVAMIVNASADYSQVDYLGGILFALVGFFLPVSLLVTPQPYLILASELSGFAFGFVIFRLPLVKRFWLSEGYMHHRVERRVLRAFYEHRLHETENQNGILILVSLLERRVRILADRGIYGKVDPKVWEEMADKLAEALRTGSLSDGLCNTIRRCGEILSDHFPLRHGGGDLSADMIVVDRD
ncbi:MAG TPA: TPM domain-containing protein [Nitrospiria bacterium]|nr:TPM domain-containing protein [Nitrospiria bacterium]